MSEQTESGRAQRIRAAIEAFLHDRLQGKISKLQEDDPKRAELIAQFQTHAWLEDAARRVKQIQAVTHSLKPIHPDARGTSLYCDPAQLHTHDIVGSHLLNANFAADVVGNAAALDVYKLLKIEVDGQTLLTWLIQNDAAAIEALHTDAEIAAQWHQAFISLIQPRESTASSHVLAKQLYWLVESEDGIDPTDDDQYHLLAPLYATSLVHAVYAELQEARFGEANKAARLARRENKAHDGVFHDYPDLAVQKLGGTKPQNISQLNSERGGTNYLLSSLPPTWKSRELRQPWGLRSIFDHMLLAREGVRPTLHAFLAFLRSNPPANAETRNRVDGYVSHFIDEMVALAGELQRGWPTNWTADARCELRREEQLWLDPLRARTDEAFRADWMAMNWPAQIGKNFAGWLNTHLEKEFTVGDAEMRQWKKELLLDESEGGWAQELHKMRSHEDIKAPHYIPTRKGVVQ